MTKHKQLPDAHEDILYNKLSNPYSKYGFLVNEDLLLHLARSMYRPILDALEVRFDDQT